MEIYQIIVIIAIILTILFLGIFIFAFKRKKKIRQAEEFPDLLVALGGKDNITNVDYKGSRVSVVVDNKKNVDKEKVKEQGVETIVISNKKVTMVVGVKKSILIFNYLNEQINI